MIFRIIPDFYEEKYPTKKRENQFGMKSISWRTTGGIAASSVEAPMEKEQEPEITGISGSYEQDKLNVVCVWKTASPIFRLQLI